jgi:hypothetical protein
MRTIWFSVGFFMMCVVFLQQSIACYCIINLFVLFTCFIPEHQDDEFKENWFAQILSKFPQIVVSKFSHA